MKKIILIIAVCILGSCSYEELPPKTDDASSNYILPKGDIPSASDLATQAQIKAEYNNAIK